MKNLLFTLFLACSLMLFNVGFSQSFNIDLRNFEQVNETEFTFEAYIQNESGVPYTLFAYQFQLEFDAGIKNGGVFENGNLSVEGESELTGVNQPLSTGFTSVAAGRLQFASEQYLGTNVEATYLDDATEYKIDKFRVKLSKDGSPHLFADMAPDWKFNLIGTSVTKADDVDVNNTTIIGPNFTLVTRNKPATATDHNLGDRQMAGYFYTGNGGWDETANWNNVTVVNNNTLPGANSNAIINGNLTLSAATDATSVFSLEPDGNGNGGELTLKTGEEPIYLITIESTNDAYSVAISDENGAPNWLLTPGASGRSISLAAGTNVKLYTSDPNFVGGTFTQWVDDDGPIGSAAAGQDYLIPAKAITITAQWDPPLKGEPIIPVNYKSRSGKDLFASITINPGAALVVDQLYNDNENGAEAIIVKSDATGTGYLIHNNAGVLATVERYMSETVYHYLGSPITDGQWSILGGTFGVDDFWTWEETTRIWTNLNHPDEYVPTNILTPGKGYAVAFAPTKAVTKVFAGEVNTGTIGFNATFTPGSTPPYWNQRGFNLVANPYPAATDADAYINANSDVSGLYLWDEAADYEGQRNDYATYSLAGGVAGGNESHIPDGVLAPMQGFMVKVDAEAMVNFTNDMRITDDSYFFKGKENMNRIWLNVTGPEGDFNQTMVAFLEGAEEGYDRTDAQKLKGNEKLAFYSILEGADFAIQGRPILTDDQVEVPLGLDAGFAGTYTFTVHSIENFEDGTEIFFEDRVTGTMVDLKNNEEFTVQLAETGEYRDRFFVVFKGATAISEIEKNNEVHVYASNQTIFIEHTGAENINDIEVINIVGQVVQKATINSQSASLRVPGNNVVYIVKVGTKSGFETHKVLVR